MPSYALWNNKGGVGKSYLTFQIACQYAITHPEQKILVLDLCPQANSSIMLLGGMERGERVLDGLATTAPKKTISGYIEDRLRNPYASPKTGSTYVIQPQSQNKYIPDNVYLVAGDEELEIQSSRVSNATRPGPPDAWRVVHSWIADLISDIKDSWGGQETTVFIDCNPSFTIYTELALSATDRIIIPFSADGSSKRAVRAVLALLYGINRNPGTQQSEFSLNSKTHRLTVPEIYCYVGNRLTRANSSSAKAFRSVVSSIGEEIWKVWISKPSLFCIHPTGVGAPSGKRDFKAMFQAEISDANTASVVSGALGIPITKLTAGDKTMPDGSTAHVNDSQLQQQQPSIRSFVATIE
ncbi:ParA family protein [Falsiroseomonas selenitidurans]|uniref:ParA family protein n=1 Tax=Falsiroseomonas selenitidurans TaxID=2716335 RepID=A0ABX1E085_9PROT|nr:ParA family protein [Falsiroseomonas selenitidurans]NKC30178.1 ParA family protein [Falsiroseomonas selenitidurans]